MTVANHDAWDLTNHFTIAQAAALWLGVEPEGDSVEDGTPAVRALARQIGRELRVGDPRDFGNHRRDGRGGCYRGYDGTTHSYEARTTTRAELTRLADRLGKRPLFLFKADRPQPERPSEPVPGVPQMNADVLC